MADANKKALVWDKDSERLYETGVKKGVLYPKATNGTYPLGVAWNGLSSVTETPSGAESNPIYADDIKYVDLRSVEEFGGTIEAYTYPDEWAECDGSAAVADGVIFGQQARKAFGLAYRTILGNDTEFEDYAYKLHLVYNSLATPSERQYQTVNDSPEAITFSWEFESTAVAVGKLGGKTLKPVSCITINSRDFTDAKADYLKKLEEILYGKDPTTPGGSDGVAPRLPLPAEVYKILTTGKAEGEE